MKHLTSSLNVLLTALMLTLLIGIFNPVELMADQLAQANDPVRRLEPGESPFSKENLDYDHAGTSRNPNPVDYALPYVDIRSGDKPLVMDYNGDGLQDLVYSSVSNATSSPNADAAEDPSVKQYVLLGNGKDYDLVYTCLYDYLYNVETTHSNEKFYWGDCKDPSSVNSS